jgi:acyl-CoA synthetase (AMP-forming)/AMP-acid ligase II
MRRLASIALDVAGGSWATAKVAARVGVGPPIRPDRLIGMAAGFRRWGMTPAAACAMNAARDPSRIAVIDERESVSYGEVDRRSSIVATALARLGIGGGDPVELLARNSSAFIVAQIAVSKLGADVLYVNTGFAGPQLGEVLRNENVVAVIADDEFAPTLDDVAGSLPRLTAWVHDNSAPATSVAGLVHANDGLASPRHPHEWHNWQAEGCGAWCTQPDLGCARWSRAA